jgi:putative flippase GtrA
MTLIIKNPKERSRFLRFAVVGAIGAVVDFGTFNLLNGLLGIAAVVAQSLSFGAAVASNFTWNRFWTYPDSRTKAVSSQLGQFFIVSIVGLAIRTPIFIIMERPLTSLFRMLGLQLRFVPGSTSQFLGHNAALAVAILVVMMWNFYINRRWTYNDVE